MFTSTGSKVAGASAVVAIPSATAVGVYKEEIFGPSLENTYWRFFYLTLTYHRSVISNKEMDSWQKLKDKCKDWTMDSSNTQSFLTNVQKSDSGNECWVITAFSKTKNNEWGKYLGYFNTFNTSKWRNKNILYSDDTNLSSNPNQYRHLFEEIKKASTEVKDEKLAKPDNWHPSRS